MPLLEELVKKGFIEKKQADSLKKEIDASGNKEEEVILKENLVSEEVLFNLKSQYLNVPLKDIDPKKVSLEILELIPEETARHYKMVALVKKGGILEVGMIYPEDLDAQEALKFLARRGNFKTRIYLISPSTFEKILKQHRTLKREVGQALETLEKELEVKRRPELVEGVVERLTEETPITKVVGVILRYAVEGKASDIHIEPGKERLRARFRLLGTLHSSIFLPARVHRSVVSRIKVLSRLKLDENRIPQDGRFSAHIAGKDIDFRVSTFPTILGEKVVIRVLDPTVGLKEFEELGLAGRNTEVVRRQVKKPYGLILATGPTGCGKTTSLYAILRRLNKEGVNIVTLEDPVEYFIKGVNQSQVRPEIGYGFAQGLRHLLRQDPDIIMVGEIRDEETADLVTHAALTGHLVLSTLHTNDSLGVIPRLLDLGVQPFLIPPTLSLVIAQRLVRKLCDKCKKKVKPPREIKELILKEIQGFPSKIRKEIEIPKPLYFWKAEGCRYCSHKGFSGRIGIFEILEMTSQLGEIILGKISETRLKKEAERQSMITMRQDGILKVLKGVTTIGEVLKVTREEKI